MKTFDTLGDGMYTFPFGYRWDKIAHLYIRNGGDWTLYTQHFNPGPTQKPFVATRVPEKQMEEIYIKEGLVPVFIGPRLDEWGVPEVAW